MAKRRSKDAAPVAKAEIVSNSLEGALGLNQFPGNQGTPGSAQLSQPTTMFKNLRWYLVSNDRQFLSEMYVELGLVQTIVDVPVDDALRGGIEIKSKQLSEEQIEDLLRSVHYEGDLRKAGQAEKWNRLFGGAGVIVLSDQDPMEPLDLDSLSPDDPIDFRAVDMWELFWDKQQTEGFNPAIQEDSFEFYNYYGEQIHKSRVMKMTGLTAPSFIRPRLRGWGFSVVETLVRSMNQYLKATDLAFEVLDEFKIDVFKIKNLTNTLLSHNGMEKISKRVQIANFEKNYNNALTMDSEDDWDHKQLSFAGLGEAMLQIRMQVASDMRMPMTKLFGISAAGFNSGEDDIEVYNSMVENQVRAKIEFPILRMLEIKCAKMFGMVPDDLSIAFKPLRVMSSEQEENVKTQKFNRVSTAMQSGQLTQVEYRDALNKGNLLDISLDTSEAALPSPEDVASAQGQDGEDSGADEVDSKGSRAPKGKGSPPDAPKAKEAKTQNEGWDENKHPRADDGKFGEGGGGKAKTKVYHGTYAKFASKDIKASEGGYFGPGYYVHKDKEMTGQYGDTLHSYDLESDKTFDLSGETLKPEALKFCKEIGLDADEIAKPTKFGNPVSKLISQIRKKFPGEETVGSGAMLKLQELLKENGYIGIQFRHNDSDENMVIFDKKNLGIAEEKKKNSSDAYSLIERLERILKNSAAFDRASYEADGGDAWIDSRKREFYENPVGVDWQIWSKALAAASAAGGGWQMTLWLYRKFGGKHE